MHSSCYSHIIRITVSIPCKKNLLIIIIITIKLSSISNLIASQHTMVSLIFTWKFTIILIDQITPIFLCLLLPYKSYIVDLDLLTILFELLMLLETIIPAANSILIFLTMIQINQPNNHSIFLQFLQVKYSLAALLLLW